MLPYRSIALLIQRRRPKNKPVASVACSKVQKSFAKFALTGNENDPGQAKVQENYKIQINNVGGLRTCISYTHFRVLVNHSGSFLCQTLGQKSLSHSSWSWPPLPPHLRETELGGNGKCANHDNDPSGARKCFQGSSATAAARNRPGIVHSVCWAPRNTTDGPEV